ncbi:coiled-coil domain-containing 55 [Fusarium albosuccineum]|uniref:Coiled-coil domain-containing 55 n=1 Tax=Fusarium albosuccineum TaxID=1237068 RepID=A0A8H4LG05_9HYPO|nr:coiled-coil domain-containing 55 [Fusarium albosuccineum]
MSKPGLAFGLNLTKKPGASKPAPPKRRPMFGDDDDSDNDGANGEGKAEEIGEFDDFGSTSKSKSTTSKPIRSKNGPPTQPPKLKSKGQTSMMFGDLSSSLTSKKNAQAAAEVDASVYEYDSVYDSLKPKKQTTKEDEERRPKYMRNLMQAAEVRKRDALIAEEKKIAREREAEGDEYADKEKFVTEAYRKQQEENKRLEEEERRREEEEAKKNKGGGMSAFYRKLLDKDEQRHSDAIKAAEEKTKHGENEPEEKEDAPKKEKTEADVAREMNEKGAAVAINEDGQVVDKRQLLRGGLNLGAKKKESVQRDTDRQAERPRKEITGQQIGKRQAQRERQSRMMAEQLEQSLKRSREEEATQREEVERAAKSRKTEGEISSAKERYLARKKAAEEEKKKKAGGGEA